MTTVYHEGVPGHHLQVGADRRTGPSCSTAGSGCCAGCSGHGEGWALYAERLMDELGYLDDPGDKLGMLDGQALRAARVIVDIGMHLELEIPRDNPFGFHPGERWTPELGWEFMRAHCRMPDEDLRFEREPLPGLAGAGAVVQGRRADLAAGPRRGAKARKGADFDLKEFHRAGARPRRARASTRCAGAGPPLSPHRPPARRTGRSARSGPVGLARCSGPARSA